MKKLLLLCSLTLFFACKKETTYPYGTPDCVKKIATSFKYEAKVKRMTDGTSLFWSVQTEGSPQIADDEIRFILNDNCDTLCTVCFCANVKCTVDLANLKDVNQ
jgi:hypothetical protein